MYIKHNKSRLVHAFTIFLSVLLLITSINLEPLLVIGADGDNGNLTSITGSVQYFPLGFSNAHQGYRFYVIDNQGNCVSKVVDFVYSENINVSDSHWYTNTRWTNLSTDKSNYDVKHISKLMTDFCDGADPTPYDITSSEMYPVHIESQKYVGAKFQLWFLGKEGRGSQGVANSADRGNFGDSGGGSVNNNNKQDDILAGYERILADYTTEELLTLRTNINKGQSILDTYDSEEKAKEMLDFEIQLNPNYQAFTRTDVNKINTTYRVSYTALTQMGFSDEIAKRNAAGSAYNKAKSLGLTTSTAMSLTAIIVAGGEINGAYYHSSLVPYTSEDLLNTNIPLSNLESSASLDSTENNSTLESLESMGISVDKLSSILDIRIPLAEAEQTEYNFPIDRFLSKESTPEKPYPFMVKGFNQDLSGNGSVTLLDALKYKENGKFKYGLIVEPIFWAGMYASSTSYENWYTYGSYYNILQYYISKGYTGAGCHASYMKAHGKNCMVVSKNVTDFGTDTFQIKEATDSSRMELGEILKAIDERKEGYGMHFYFAGDLEPSGSSTSTYDEPLGTTISPAPDPSSLPPETSDYPTTSKQVTIIKNYVTREESIGTEVVDGNFIRTLNPHIINIEDEPEYTVIQWETSTHPTPIHHKSIL